MPDRWTVTKCLECGAITAHDPHSELWPVVCADGGEHGPTQKIEVQLASIGDEALAALDEIAARPTSQRNPDGDEHAAHTMALLAKEHAKRIREMQ